MKKIFIQIRILMLALCLFALPLSLSAVNPLFYGLVSTLTTTTTTLVNYFSDYLFSGLTRQERLQRFLDENRAQVAGDMSKGGGAYVDAVAAIVDVYPMQRGQFGSLMQQNFERIFPEDSFDAGLSATSILEITREASYCGAEE